MYKVDELGIDETAGGAYFCPLSPRLSLHCTDTPLCPFDCQCCECEPSFFPTDADITLRLLIPFHVFLVHCISIQDRRPLPTISTYSTQDPSGS